MPRVCQVVSHSLAASIISPFHTLRNGLHKWVLPFLAGATTVPAALARLGTGKTISNNGIVKAMVAPKRNRMMRVFVCPSLNGFNASLNHSMRVSILLRDKNAHHLRISGK
jgi:hypothetical protein